MCEFLILLQSVNVCVICFTYYVNRSNVVWRLLPMKNQQLLIAWANLLCNKVVRQSVAILLLV